jgi:hypothetical protein
MMSIKIGTYTGTGAVVTVALGFVPDYIQIINATDGDIASIFFNGMTADTSFDIGAAAITNAADGITVYAGDTATDAVAGFQVGTDMSESAKVYYYVAARSDQ